MSWVGRMTWLGGAVFGGELGEEFVDHVGADGLDGLADGGQGGVGVLGEGEVVEADDGDVVGDAAAQAVQGVQGAGGRGGGCWVRGGGGEGHRLLLGQVGACRSAWPAAGWSGADMIV